MQLSQAEAEQKWAELCEQVLPWMQEHEVPGVAIGLLAGGKTYMEGFGVTSLTNPLPVTPETLFQIGSTTKTVTATVLMRLVEQGKIDLNAKVRHYLPDFRVADEAAAANVTVQQLLTHTAGWNGDLFLDTGYGDDALARYVEKMADLAQLAPLGELFAYNNAGFSVAGRLIEVVTGQSVEAAIRELLLAPLGMNQSFFFPAEVMTKRFAVGHLKRDPQTVVAEPWPIPRNANAAGGLSCSIGDQLRYARFCMGDGRSESGERLLSPATMAQMQSPHVTAADGEGMGLTWFIRHQGGQRFVLHGGSTNGQRSLFWLAPDAGLALVVVTNHDMGPSVSDKVSDWVRREFLGVNPEPEVEPLALPAEELQAYVGRFADISAEVQLVAVEGRLQLRLTIKRDPLVMPEPPVLAPMMLDLLPGERIRVADGRYQGVTGEFLRTKDGRRWLRFGLRVHAWVGE